MKLIFILIIFLLAGCITQIELIEPEIDKNIVGEWVYRENNPPLNFTQWFKFESSGYGTFGNAGGCLASEGKGIWSLSGTTIHIKVTDGQDFLADLDERYEILYLSSNKLKLRTIRNGEVHTFKREK